jgi:hypothetical protein
MHDIDTSSTIGNLADAVRHGAQRILVIPIERPYPDPARPGHLYPKSGKKPAYLPNPSLPDGPWVGLDEWEKAATVKDRADRFGANVGLILGVPTPALHAQAIDVDLAWISHTGERAAV